MQTTLFSRNHRWTLVALTLLATAVTPGCQVDFGPGLGLPEEDRPSEIDDDEVAVSFVNRTLTDAVDVQFYATNEAIATLPDDLFTEENLITRGIGLAGSGILGPRDADQIVFPCTKGLTLGTLGGEFLDKDSGDVSGPGVSRWAQEEPLGLCGSSVTFEFFEDRGDFNTRLIIGPADSLLTIVTISE